MVKRSKEWSEKISKAIAQKWKDKEYRQKQEQSHHSEEYRSDRSREMKDEWQTDAFKEKMTGETHPNWNPNREEVQRNYGPGWYSQKDEQRNSLREEQGDRDGLTGEKFKTQNTIVRHHIDHDKLNNDLDNLCALTPETHALVHNESLMSRNECIKAFQEGKENLKQGIPPDHWNEKNKEDFKNDIEQENNPISENHGEKKKEDKNDVGDKKESDSASENSNTDDKEEIPKDSKQKDDKDENQSEDEDKDITDKKSEESVDEDREEGAGETKEEHTDEDKDGEEENFPENQVSEPLEPSIDAPTDESDRQQETQTEKSSDNLSKEALERTPHGINLKPFDSTDQEKEKPKEKPQWDGNRGNKRGSYTLTSGAEYDKLGNKISPDYKGIDQIQNDKGDEFKGLDEKVDNIFKDYDKIGEIIAEKGADFDGIDSTQERGDKDYVDIDEGYGEGGYEGG